jgi:hypothetical protein
MIEEYEKEAIKDLESFYGTDLELTDKGKAWVAGYVQAKLRQTKPLFEIDWNKAPEWAEGHSLGFHEGYEKGWTDATSQAIIEIQKNYKPNDR